ncbi:unnamed protein product [Rotaria sordida]|uniref:Uncharacterized protein n=1 Tax=Rotaria sordida TaxID=392033 RepID=A0A819JJX5_9BILA|nr:unnamed protein product [Rotaria sordida]
MSDTTKQLLRGLLDTHRAEQNVDVPLSRKNTFLFDNEPFRYLALRENGIQLDTEQTLSYSKSWDYSAKEYSRLMAHIVTCPLHGISVIQEKLSDLELEYCEAMDSDTVIWNYAKKTIQGQRNSENTAENLRSEDIFTLVGTLYRLPINGKQIREQVQGVEISQGEYSAKREVLVDLPAKAASSKVVLQLKDIISQR